LLLRPVLLGFRHDEFGHLPREGWLSAAVALPSLLWSRLARGAPHLPTPVPFDADRQEERRAERESTPQERRKSDRRRKPPFTWEMADFVVTESKAGTKKKK